MVFRLCSLHSSAIAATAAVGAIASNAISNGSSTSNAREIANKKRSYQHTIYSITATHIYNMCIEMISVYAIFH